jgi:hypothetical protein
MWAMNNVVLTNDVDGHGKHQDTLWYVTIEGGGYWPWMCKFKLRDYFYL